jgi:hypothetical protein
VIASEFSRLKHVIEGKIEGKERDGMMRGRCKQPLDDLKEKSEY